MSARNETYYILGLLRLGAGAHQKVEKRGQEERREQTSEEGHRCAQQCSLQRGGAQGGRAEEATGPFAFFLMQFITTAGFWISAVSLCDPSPPSLRLK